MVKACGGKRKEAFGPGAHNAISIIIVTRNAASYLQHCLDSVKAQQEGNYEVLIFDGDSTDNTVDILKQNDPFITYWQSEPDKGIYDAMNKAVHHAHGHWLYFLGADDVLLPGFSQFAQQLTDKQTIHYGDCITDKGNMLGGFFSAYRLSKMNICHHAVFYPSAVFKKYKYPLRYPVYADYALNIQCWGDSSFRKKYIPILIAKFHSGGFSSVVKNEPFKKEKAEWIKRYLGRYVYLRYRLKRWKEGKKKASSFF